VAVKLTAVADGTSSEHWPKSSLSPFRQIATATDFAALGVGMVCWRRSPQVTTPVVVVFLL